MKKTFWHYILLLIALIVPVLEATAVPAPRGVLPLRQPDGTSLNAWLKGDEFFHYAVSTDGYVLLPDSKGYYNYAETDSQGMLKAGKRRALNEEQRTQDDRTYLKTIKPGLSFSREQLAAARNNRLQKSLSRTTALRSAGTAAKSAADQYPTTGSPKSLVILVNFSDVKFETTHTTTTFSNMLNKVNYKENNHFGSSRDYYKYNSGDKFSPDFVVVGPVTLSRTRDYYGENDGNDNDKHPALMVKEACEQASASVDFSNFDNDNDGYVDNIYVFYAGQGEADGGGANTIWPHSWALSGENLSLVKNGKIINAYACSAELKGSGNLAGIGTFTHEYGHILGLLDMYDTDYEANGQSFDLGTWSLMAYGAYNNDGNTPPCLTLLERSMLNWADPAELKGPSSITLSELGSSNQGCLINTNNPNEFYLLENRQQVLWDTYLPYHGMLIYHIDLRTDANTKYLVNGVEQTNNFASLWNLNMVNAIANHQCVDLVEADNQQISSLNNVRRDPFPGLGGKDSFTDSTLPSMKTWSGLSLNKAITSITEKDGQILFEFMGGASFSKVPVSLPAKNVMPFQFAASWNPVENATGYFLDVYTQDGASVEPVRKFVEGYENVFVRDTFLVVKVPADGTRYYYSVRATNNFTITQNSETQNLYTPDGTPETLPATNVRNFGLTANWTPKSWATGYYFDLYTVEKNGGDSTLHYINGYQDYLLTDSTLTIEDLDDQTDYHYRVRATTGFAETRYSNVYTLTTPKASAVVFYEKNKTIYLKGIDPGSMVRIYDLSGLLLQTSYTNKIAVEKAGIYLVEALFDGKVQKIKMLIQ